MGTRLVVTGHDESGKAVFASDERVVPTTLAILPGLEFHQLWASDEPQSYPDSGAPPEAPSYLPPVGGFRFIVVSMPPEGDDGFPDDLESAFEESETKLPGLMGAMEQDEPGMHTTDTTDFDIVMSGTLVLELDDGAEVTLTQGDVVIQNGTRHRWRNPGDVPAVLGTAMIGAHRTSS